MISSRYARHVMYNMPEKTIVIGRMNVAGAVATPMGITLYWAQLERCFKGCFLSVVRVYLDLVVAHGHVQCIEKLGTDESIEDVLYSWMRVRVFLGDGIEPPVVVAQPHRSVLLLTRITGLANGEIDGSIAFVI